MSLLSDPDYLIHQLRLTYLRHVDDSYGPRILSLSPGYMSNQHIMASGLADQELWQELAMPSTPGDIETESRDATRRNSGFLGATGLRYTQTIVGQTRAAGLGMRVNAKRASFVREAVPSVDGLELNGRRHRSDSEPTPVAVSPIARSPDPRPEKPGSTTLLRRKSVDAAELEEAPSENPPTKVEPFKPPFARAAEMEARRQLRMRSRFAPTGISAQPMILADKSSVDAEVSDEEMSDDEDDLLGDALEIEDAPDDELYTPRIVLDASVSDGTLSAGNSGMSHSSGVGQFNDSNLNVRSNGHLALSPVHENRSNLQSDKAQPLTPPHQMSDTLNTQVTPQRTYKSEDSYFELVVLPSRGRNDSTSGNDTKSAQIKEPPNPVLPVEPIAQSSVSVLTFNRVKVPSVPEYFPPSALSIILASKASKVDNPFSELYSLISSRSNPLVLQVTFPFSLQPKKPVTLNVRSDATVEEVIGFALWTYWEEGFMPKLDEGDETRQKDRLSATGWSLRITEDGEVDDDFPALERMLRMSKFNFDGYAIVLETQAQIEQNRSAEAKIVRRPSRVLISKKKSEPTSSLALSSPHVVGGSSVTTLAPLSSSLGGGSNISPGPQQFLRVKVPGESSVIHISTTIPVKDGMYMEEALESVCRRRIISDPKQWCLVYEMKLLVPPDRTIRSLQGHRELFLVKLEDLRLYPEIREIPRSTDPNASIFSRISEVPEQQYSAALDFTHAYKKYTVYRKMPMLVVRHERTLAIDGDYIHIMPPSTRGFLDSMKTSSYHIKSVMACTQSAKSSSNFKLVVARDGGNKRYDFEAENPKIAGEIVRNIRDLRTKRLERYSTMNRSRRSRPPV